MTEALDKIDLRILGSLQEDASRSAAEIADAVGLSQSPCWRRIQRLKEEGYISRTVALVDRHKLDLQAQLFVQVKVLRNDQVNLAEFSHAIRNFPEVMECHMILGMFDFLLRVVTQDITAYEKFFLEKLSRVPNVREFNSYVTVSEIKSTTALPLRYASGSSVAAVSAPRKTSTIPRRVAAPAFDTSQHSIRTGNTW
jgi:Lrp/AsnC family transcriptional regulator